MRLWDWLSGVTNDIPSLSRPSLLLFGVHLHHLHIEVGALLLVWHLVRMDQVATLVERNVVLRGYVALNRHTVVGCLVQSETLDCSRNVLECSERDLDLNRHSLFFMAPSLYSFPSRLTQMYLSSIRGKVMLFKDTTFQPKFVTRKCSCSSCLSSGLPRNTNKTYQVTKNRSSKLCTKLQCLWTDR